MKKNRKKTRVTRAVGVKVEETFVQDEQQIAAFYVDNTSIGGGDPTHQTTWEDIEEAAAAAREYILALNAWWASGHPGEMYLDPDFDVIIDNVHLNGSDSIRAGVLPNVVDSPPPPDAPAVLLTWTDGSDWVVF